MTAALDTLVSPLGVVRAVRRVIAPRGLPRIELCTADAGSGHPGVPPRDERGDQSGTGRVLDDGDLSRLIAIAETAERYAGANLHEPGVRATVADLDGAVLDPARYPRCSEKEYAAPDCPLVPFDPAAPIRWVRGFDLHTGAPTWVPAVMACYSMRPEPAERFAYQISTGHAVHTDPVKAILSGLLESVERDAISLTWLQQLPLPLVPSTVYDDDLRHLLAWCDRRFLRTYLFDATTDLGLATVYLLQQAPHDPEVRTVIGASSGGSLGEAARRALIEVVTLREAYYSDDLVTDFAAFGTVLDGARFMSRPEQAGAFGFLLDGLDARAGRTPAPDLPGEPAAALRTVLDRLAAAGMTAVVVDRTSRELRDVGLTDVAVVAPDLQPMSLLPLAQFRGHRRLYDAPGRMGLRCLSEEEQNPWPQPFA